MGIVSQGLFRISLLGQYSPSLFLPQIECQHLDLITGANLGKNAMLAFRILTSSGKIYLEYVVNKVKEELEKSESEGGGPEKVSVKKNFSTRL